MLCHLFCLTNFLFLWESRDNWVNCSSHRFTGKEIGLWPVVFSSLDFIPFIQSFTCYMSVGCDSVVSRQCKMIKLWQDGLEERCDIDPAHLCHLPGRSLGEDTSPRSRKTFLGSSASSVLPVQTTAPFMILDYFTCQSPDVWKYN